MFFVFAIAMFLLHNQCTGTSDECRDGWKTFMMNIDDTTSVRFVCYRLFNNKVTWNTASKKCRQNKSELVTISREDIQNFIYHQYVEITHDTHWMGLRRYREEKREDWLWESCISDEYQNWEEGEPQGNGEFCANLKTNGKWDSASCENCKSFVCQYFPDEESDKEYIRQHIRSSSVEKELNLIQRTCFRKAVTKAIDIESVPQQDLIIYSETYSWLKQRSANNTRNIADFKNDTFRWILKDYRTNNNRTDRFLPLWMEFNSSILGYCESHDPVTILFISQSNFSLSIKPYFAEGKSDNYTESIISNWFILDKYDIMNITLSLEFTVEIQNRSNNDYETKKISCTDLNGKRRCPDLCDCNKTDVSDESSITCSANNAQHGIEVFVIYTDTPSRPCIPPTGDEVICSNDGKDAYWKGNNRERERERIEVSCDNSDFVVNIFGHDLEKLSGRSNAELFVKEDISDFDAQRELKPISSRLVIEFKIDGMKHSIPVNFALKYQEISDIPQYSRMLLNESKICAFWNESDHAWSDEGCEVLRIDKNKSMIECFCAHTTSFAILVKFESCKINKVLSVITWIGLVISSLALVLALLIYFALRKSLTEIRFTIHKHLMIAVLCASITFLVGASFEEQKDRTSNLCETVATLRYFCYFAIFMWMLVEGIHIFRRIVLVFQGGQTRTSVYIIIGWGIPLVVTLILFIKRLATNRHLEDCNVCWFGRTSEPTFFWIFFATIILVCSINFAIMVCVTRIVASASKRAVWFEKKTLVQLKASIRSSVMMIILLGLPWSIIPIVYLPYSFGTVAEYLFIILNTLQGLFVAVIHCFANTEVKNGLKRRTEKKSYSMEILEERKRKTSIATILSEK